MFLWSMLALIFWSGMILENFGSFNGFFFSVVYEEPPESGGSYFWNNPLNYEFCG